ncbi:MAG: DNA mismatch repair protein MutS [Ginsengibacter sp.]
MKYFPESALYQLEFENIKSLLSSYCNTEFAKGLAENLRIHTKYEFIQPALQQTHEYQLLLQSHQAFPDNHQLKITNELKLLFIDGAMLQASQLVQLKHLAETMQKIFRWFDVERRTTHPTLFKVIENSYYEKTIVSLINDIIDEAGNVKDNASEELSRIRVNLYRKRGELRRLFNRIVSRLSKDGYLADIEESFMNGRRVLAVFAEQKRMVKGILHGESDSRRTAFIEPEETTGLNNEIYSMELEEVREINKILLALTKKISVYAPLLKQYHDILGEYDFIQAKAKLAVETGGNFIKLTDKALLNLRQAYHPLLYLFNKKAGKPTIPLNLYLDEANRILVISGPNAGGKTVTLKTAGLLQLMVQSGLLVPCSADSEMGIFKQLMIHIGDTQSLEFELSTYSSHLKNMKYFLENANGKTLFFIDELGSGSDPNLGGAFAEVIMEELARKHAMGVVTTHYLNLKVMANKVPGIINGAMAFDEVNLKPLYQLTLGKPGSSYTFSIAERIGLNPALIKRARQLVDEDHFSLDKLLNRTEQDLQKIDKEKMTLKNLLTENEKLKNEMNRVINTESHKQKVEILKHQNKVSEEKLTYLKDLDRKLKKLVIDWRKSENKQEVIKQMNALLFRQNEKQVQEKQQKKFESKFEEITAAILPGVKVQMKSNRRVGVVNEIRGKRAIIQFGAVPLTVELTDLVAVKEKI